MPIRRLIVIVQALWLGAAVSAALAQVPSEIESLDWQRTGEAMLPSAPAACFCDPPECMMCVATVDALILTRTPAHSQDILFVDDFDAPVFNVRDLDFDCQAGVRVDLLFGDECGCDLLLNYTGLPRVEERYSAPTTPGLFYTFYGTAPVEPADSYTISYETEYHSGELDLRTRQCSRLAPFAGLRIMQLEETFDIVDASAGSGVYSQVENEMYGTQFGAQILLYEGGCSRWETLLKAGAFYNDINVAAQAADAAGAALNLDRAFYHTAFQGELNVTWIYRLGPCAQFRLGYYALWLEGVALAPDQNDNFRIFTGEGSVDVGNAFYQGGFVGGEITL